MVARLAFGVKLGANLEICIRSCFARANLFHAVLLPLFGYRGIIRLFANHELYPPTLLHLMFHTSGLWDLTRYVPEQRIWPQEDDGYMDMAAFRHPSYRTLSSF